MANCINIKSKEVQDLSESLGLSPIITALKINSYMESNSTEIFPTTEELSNFIASQEILFQDSINTDIYLDASVGVKPGVSELFESNPELANIGSQQQYSQYLESLNKPNTNPILQGNQNIIQDDKSYYRGQIEQPTIDKNGNLVLHGREDELYKKAGLKSKGVSMTDDLQSAIEYGNGQLEVAQNLLEEEYGYDVLGYEFENKIAEIQDNGYYLIQIPKNISNEIVKEAGEVKVIGDKIVIPKGQYKIEQVIDGVENQTIPQQEQVKKFAELQERLNNEEFLEGAKNAYESSEELQQFGTQEQYNDYIARVSLGIVKNPTSGEYNYESQVKDIVYHGSDANNIEKFRKDLIGSKEGTAHWYGDGFYFTKNKEYASGYGDNMYLVLLDLKLPNIYDEKHRFGFLKDKDTDEIPKFDGSIVEDGVELVAFEPEQIHILASKKDIQGFKEFTQQSNLFESKSQSDSYLDAAINESLETPKFERVILVKQRYKNFLKNQLEKLLEQKKIYKTNPAKFSEVTNNIDKTESLVTELEKEIDTLYKATPETKLDSYFADDFNRALDLLEGDSASIKQAQNILKFYKAMNFRSNPEKHPLFTQEQIFGKDGEILLSQEMVDLLDKYASLAEQQLTVLAIKQKEAIVQEANSNPAVSAISGGLTFKQLLSNGMAKDTSYLDMFLMDGQNGIFSKNPVLRQVMQNILETSINNAENFTRNIEHRINSIQGEVERIMASKGHSLGSMGIKGTDFSIFRAVDEFGNKSKTLVQKFSKAFYSIQTQATDAFKAQLNAAKSEEDGDRKKLFYQAAFANQLQFLKQHTNVLNLSLLEDITKEIPGNIIKDSAEAQAYKQALINTYGKYTYDEYIKRQINKIKEFEVLSFNKEQELLEEEGVNDVTQLSPSAISKLDYFNQQNSPFIFSDKYHNNIKFDTTSYINHTTYLPRVNKTVAKIDANGNTTYVETNEKTGYIDENFNAIESEPILLEFYEIVKEVFRTVHNTIPVEEREDGYNPFSILKTENSLVQLLMQESTMLGKMSVFWNYLMDSIKKIVLDRTQNTMSYSKIDPITGEKVYKVSTSWLKTHERAIKAKTDYEVINFKREVFGASEKPLPKYLNLLQNKEALNYVIKASGLTQAQLSDASDLSNFNIFRFIHNKAENDVVVEESLDLFKVTKLYSKLSAEYKARTEMLPTLEIMKQYYNSVKAIELDKFGRPVVDENGEFVPSDEDRTKAKKQMDSWFERAVVGDYNSKSEFGNKYVGSVKYTSEEKKIKEELEASIKILDEDYKTLMEKGNAYAEKAKYQEMQQAYDVAELYQKISASKKEELKSLGGRLSTTSMLDSVFYFIRYKALGWGLNSSISNFAEGQIANTIAVGKYLNEESYIKAQHIVKGSAFKSIGLPTENSKKLSVLMKKFDILQDASNELQKASAKTNFSKLNVLAPYEIVKRIEFMNQAPIFLSLLMDQKITGIDGTESNVWEALDSKGNLLENFRTTENILNWESASQKEFQEFQTQGIDTKRVEYNNFKNRVTETIVKVHGDYHNLRGNMASEYVIGKAVLGFKRWIGSALFNRFAPEQSILALGNMSFKGRYRSFTASSGAVFGAAALMIPLGLPGIAIGGAVGLLGGKLFGVKSNLNTISELGNILAESVLKIIGTPTNLLLGKTFIPTKMKALDTAYQNQTDTQNIREITSEIALMLSMTALLITIKALAKGLTDDDEDEYISEATHNLMVNKLMQLHGQAVGYLNGEVGENLVDIALYRFAVEVGKIGSETADAIMGEDTKLSGPNAGESGLGNQVFKTLAPAPIKGFSAIEERQFETSGFDRLTKTDKEKAQRELRKLKMEYKKELEDIYGEGHPMVAKKLKKRFKPVQGGKYIQEIKRQESLKD